MSREREGVFFLMLSEGRKEGVVGVVLVVGVCVCDEEGRKRKRRGKAGVKI